MLGGLRNFEAESYAVLRMVAGFLFSFHGFQKILGWFTDNGTAPFGGQMWIGGIIELMGGLSIMLGWQTRLMACLASGTMAVAYFQFHWKFQLGEQFLPGVNRGELAVIYCFLFLFISCRGAGKWGLDKKN